MTAASLIDDRLAQATQLQLTWWRFRRHRLAVVSLAVVALFYLAAIFADFLAVADPHATDARECAIAVRGAAIREGRARVLSSTDLRAHNSFERPSALAPVDAPVPSRDPPRSLTTTLAPCSANASA